MRRKRKAKHAKSGRETILKHLVTAGAIIGLLDSLINIIVNTKELIKKLIMFLNK